MIDMTGYCHIGSQRERVPTQVWVGRLGSEGGVGGAGPTECDLPWGRLGVGLIGTNNYAQIYIIFLPSTTTLLMLVLCFLSIMYKL